MHVNDTCDVQHLRSQLFQRLGSATNIRWVSTNSHVYPLTQVRGGREKSEKSLKTKRFLHEYLLKVLDRFRDCEKF